MQKIRCSCGEVFHSEAEAVQHKHEKEEKKIKAYLHGVYFRCPECGYAMLNGYGTPTVECLNKQCKNYGKKFEAPEFKLKEIKK